MTEKEHKHFERHKNDIAKPSRQPTEEEIREARRKMQRIMQKREQTLNKK